MKRVLLVANVAKEHVLKFHMPTVKELKKRGWTVDVACADEDEIPGCDQRFIMSWKRSPLSRKTLGEIRRLRRIIEDGNYDIVYCHTPMGGLASRLASIRARRRGTKVIYCVHGFHFFKGAPLLNWLVYYPAEKFLSLFTDGIITINSEDHEAALSGFSRGRNIYRIHGMGADFSRLKIEDGRQLRTEYRRSMEIPDDADIMLYVAELTANKNQKMLVDTIGELVKRGRNAYLVLAGPDKEDGRLENYAKNAGLYDRCRFLGWRDDIGSLMVTADVYTASSIREGMTINLIEARYVGLPVVATDNRGHRTAMDDCGYEALVPIGDHIRMADRVEEFLTRPGEQTGSEAAQDFGNQAGVGPRAPAEKMKKYDAKIIASEIADILEMEREGR